MERSHLKKHLQQQTTRNILLGIGGIIFLVIFLFTIGPSLLINFALMLDKIQGNDTTQVTKNDQQSNDSYLAPPNLDPLAEATNKQTITITGTGDTAGRTIELSVNGNTTKATVATDKTFRFSDINLAKGSNTIKAKAVDDQGKESTYSDSVTILYLSDPPKLDISSLQDGQTFSKDKSPITVTGKTDTGVKVTVNDFWAITNDDGTFSYQYTLHDGDNQLKIVATDKAGNKTEKEITIKAE
jgi:bacillopeptidase F